MKTILSIIALMFALSANAQIITATVTVTNGTTIGQSITLNGQTRYFTNYIQSYQNNILATNTIFGATSNLTIAYWIFGSSGVSVNKASTNQVIFQSQTNFLTISLSGNWGTISLATNNITVSIPVRVPPSSVSIYDLTNMANGLEQLLAGNWVTSAIPSSAPILANVATLAQIQAQGLASTNFSYIIGQNATNFARLIGLAGTNFSQQVSNYFLGLFTTYNIANITPFPDGPAFKGAAFFQPSNNVLTSFVAAYPSGLPPNLTYYVNQGLYGGEGNDIALTQTNHDNNLNSGPNYDPISGGNSITRLTAFYNNDWKAMWEDGLTFLDADTGHNLELYDHAGVIRYEQYAPGSGTPQGGIVLQGSGNVPGFVETANGVVQTATPVISYSPHWPTVCGGTVTNFVNVSQNTGSGSTSVNYVQAPANSLTNNGDVLIRTIGAEYASGTHNKDVQVVFAGTTILDTGGVVNTAATGQGASIVVHLTIQDCSTLSSATVAYTCTATLNGTAQTVVSSVGTVGGVDLTATPDFHLSLTVTSGSTGDLKIESDDTEYHPSATWQGVQ